MSFYRTERNAPYLDGFHKVIYLCYGEWKVVIAKDPCGRAGAVDGWQSRDVRYGRINEFILSLAHPSDRTTNLWPSRDIFHCWLVSGQPPMSVCVNLLVTGNCFWTFIVLIVKNGRCHIMFFASILMEIEVVGWMVPKVGRRQNQSHGAKNSFLLQLTMDKEIQVKIHLTSSHHDNVQGFRWGCARLETVLVHVTFLILQYNAKTYNARCLLLLFLGFGNQKRIFPVVAWAHFVNPYWKQRICLEQMKDRCKWHGYVSTRCQ